ncbi:MAG TPA: response regulator [Sphingomicrobium sp.]
MADEPGATLKRVYVVDDDETFRTSLLMLLEANGFVASGFSSALNFLRECQNLPPGALLLDVRMPEVSGLDLLESRDPCLVNFAVIIVTGHGDIETAVRSLKRGAVDFIEKPFSATDLINMLDSSYEDLLSRVEVVQRAKQARGKLDVLSSRELEVLQGLVAGGSHKTIARQLGISDRTVEMYRNNLLHKLGVRTTIEAVRVATIGDLKPLQL